MTLDDRNGKWTVSSNEERWTCGEEFDTREEAEAYALGDYAEECGLVDGNSVWVGQIETITSQEMAEYAVDAERVVDRIDEYLYDQVGDEIANEIDCTPAMRDDLEARLAATVRQWLDDNGLKAPSFRIGKSQRLTIEAKETT